MEPTDKQNAAPAVTKAPEEMNAVDLKAYIESLPLEPVTEDKQEVAPVPSEEVSANAEETDEVAEKEPEAQAADTPDELSQLKAEKERLLAEIEKKEKSYKELQAEFTRRNQAQRPVETSTDSKKNSKLAQLKEANPEAANLIESIIEEKVSEKVRPIEEERAIYRKRQNTEMFTKAVSDFKKSDIAELEPQVMEVFNENPQYWTSSLQEDPNTFAYLLKEALLRDVMSGQRKVVDIISKKKNEKIAADSKKKLSEEAVMTKSKTSSIATHSEDDIRKMSAAQLSKIVPRI